MKTLSRFLLIIILIGYTSIASFERTATAKPLPTIQDGVVIPPQASEANDETIQTETSADFGNQVPMDDYIQALSENAQAKIQKIAAEIDQLDDPNDEAALQRKIEKIKLEEEKARFQLELELVKDGKDQKLVTEIEKEIAHLEKIDQPVSGIPKAQPTSTPKTVSNTKERE